MLMLARLLYSLSFSPFRYAVNARHARRAAVIAAVVVFDVVVQLLPTMFVSLFGQCSPCFSAC